MIPGEIDDVPLLDRLVARWEVSQLAVVPVVFNIVSFWLGLVALAIVAKVTGAKPVTAARLLSATWLAVVALEIGRGVWSLRHRYASPRWLRAVRATVGDDAFVHALAELIWMNASEPDYVVTRPELIAAVQRQRAKHRDAARRAEGVRLVEEPVAPDPNVLADDERRRRARERRAAKAARTTS